MRLHTLQLFLLSLVEPLAQTSSQPEVVDDLRRACDALASLGEMNLAQFNELVRQTREYQTTREVAVPAYLKPVVACYDSARALKQRATAGGSNREDLVRDLQLVPLDRLEKTDLVPIATDLGCDVNDKTTKIDAIDAIWRSITGENKPRRRPVPVKRVLPPLPVAEYAQKINELKERANSPDVNREEVEQSLKQLNLEQFSREDLVQLARELSCPVVARTTKTEAIEAIGRAVLLVKETLVGAAT
jgi:hypothetical protein